MVMCDQQLHLRTKVADGQNWRHVPRENVKGRKHAVKFNEESHSKLGHSAV